MTGFEQHGKEIVLRLTVEQYEGILLALGIATGTETDKRRFYRWIKLTNEVNGGNPNFTPYEIPKEFAE